MNGISAGTTTAWLAELPSSGGKAKAASTATFANYVGLAVAPLASGLFASFLLWPLRLTCTFAVARTLLILDVHVPDSKSAGSLLPAPPWLGVPHADC